jgi:hypothetical protein
VLWTNYLKAWRVIAWNEALSPWASPEKVPPLWKVLRIKNWEPSGAMFLISYFGYIERADTIFIYVWI